MTTPSLRCRSVTGWPHHSIPQLCRVPASTGRSPKPPRPGAAPGRHGAALLRSAGFYRGMWPTRKAPALQAGSCGSVTRHLQCCARQYFSRELPRLADNLATWEAARWTAKGCPKGEVSRERDSSIIGRHKSKPEARPVVHYHQLPPFITPTPGVPKPKLSRRTVVNRVSSGCKSRRNRHDLFWAGKALAFRTERLKRTTKPSDVGNIGAANKGLVKVPDEAR